MIRRKRPPLSQKREQYVQGRAKGILVGQPLHYPAGVSERYRVELDKLITRMTREYQREIAGLWKEHAPVTMDASLVSQARISLNKLKAKFAKMFRDYAPLIVERMLGGVDKASIASLKSSLKELSGGITLKTDTMPAPLRESMKAATAENVSLIKSVSSQYHDRIEGAVMRSIQEGGSGRQTILEELESIGGMSKRRAKFIAQDQTRKVTTASNKMRAQALGIKRGRWVHSGGSAEPRPKHVAFSGKTFDLNDPPAIGDKGQKVMPGTEPNCKCIWVPLVEWGDE